MIPDTALALLLLPLFSFPAAAQTRAVMEGVVASRYTVKVDTTNARLLVSTYTYQGGISNVGLFTSSNVSIGNNNAVVLYATGTIVASTGSFQSVLVGTISANTVHASTLSATGGSFAQSILVNGAIVPSTATATQINHSTATVDDIATTDITQTNFSVCHATVTYTTSSACRAVLVYFSGNMSRAGSGTFGCKLNFKEDSAFVIGDVDKGVIHGTSASATVVMSGTFSYLIRCPAAGAHSYCLSMATYASPTSCAFEAGLTSSGNQFGVMEIH